MVHACLGRKTVSLDEAASNKTILHFNFLAAHLTFALANTLVEHILIEEIVLGDNEGLKFN